MAGLQSRWAPSEKETEKERVSDDNRDRAGRSGLSAVLDLQPATVAPLPAAALMRADAMRALVLLRPTIAGFAPSAASAAAAANPMPLVAAVIRIWVSFTAQQSKALATRG